MISTRQFKFLLFIILTSLFLAADAGQHEDMLKAIFKQSATNASEADINNMCDNFAKDFLSGISTGGVIDRDRTFRIVLANMGAISPHEEDKNILRQLSERSQENAYNAALRDYHGDRGNYDYYAHQAGYEWMNKPGKPRKPDHMKEWGCAIS